MIRIWFRDLHPGKEELGKDKMQSILGGAYDIFRSKNKFSLKKPNPVGIRSDDNCIEPNDTFVDPSDYF